MTSSIVLFFLSDLNVIVSEFYDLDVRNVKKIEIKPRRIQDLFFESGTWNLTKDRDVIYSCFIYHLITQSEVVTGKSQTEALPY